MEFNLFAAVAAAFRHIHPAMKEWEIPQVPEWGEVNKPKAVDFMRILDRELATREFIAGDAFSVADITGLVRARFPEAGAHRHPRGADQRAALAPGDQEPAECCGLTSPTELDALVARIRACRICRDAPLGRPLPHEPRPVLVPSATAKVLIASQAPGTKVHLSGVPFTDASGDRLRDWLGVSQRRVLRSEDCSRSRRWAFAFPARTPRAPTCRRAANARRPGARR